MRRGRDTRPEWLHAWLTMRAAGLVRAAFPTPAWIAEYERVRAERERERDADAEERAAA